MPIFPTPAAVTAFTETPVKVANRKKSAAGYTISFGRGTVMKKEFTMSVRATRAEKEIINTFFDTNQGGSFVLNSTDPADTTDYDVMFLQDEIVWKWNIRRRTWDTTIEFGEQ